MVVETAAAAAVAEKRPSPVEHVLPGGIGTYSISHVNSYLRAPKPEGAVLAGPEISNDDSSLCSSYAGSGGFTLWEESAAKKGKTGKENVRNNAAVLDAARAGQWGSSSERPSQSSSNNHFSSLSSSQPSGQRSQSFMEMIKSAKATTSHEDELDEDDHFALKKEISSATTLTPNELRVKVDGKGSDQKANTPRSKHSATEQRRRSKINDRFQMLRGLIPHGDQKRDKASFLLEVIEYIQFLQDKVTKYEGPYQGWNNEQTKLIPWRNNNNRIGEGFDHSQGMNGGPGPVPAALVFATKFDEKPLSVSPALAGVESDAMTNKGMAFPMSLEPSLFTGARAPPRLPSDVDNTSSRPHSQTRSCTTVDGGKLKEEDLTIEGGTISISSAYSQGLLTTLTHALQSSGVDLSQASISVQIELGKRANSRATATTSVTKDDEISPSNQGMKHSRAPTSDDSDQVQKKLKTKTNKN